MSELKLVDIPDCNRYEPTFDNEYPNRISCRLYCILCTHKKRLPSGFYICKECNGRGAIPNHYSSDRKGMPLYYICDNCEETGIVSWTDVTKGALWR